MSEENAASQPGEAPESPAIVKKASDTVAKAKVRPSKLAPEKRPETPGNPPESAREIPPETPGKSDNALSIFGWDV